VPNVGGRSRRLGRTGVLVLVVAVALGATSSTASLTGKAPVAKTKPVAAAHTAAAPPITIPVATTTTNPSPVLTVMNVTPPNRATGIGFRAPIVVTYNRAPGLATPLPAISPPMTGQWDETARHLKFIPTNDWEFDTTYRVRIPVSGGNAGTGLVVVKFTTRLPSVLTLQQDLAMLGYLPLRFTPTGDADNRKAVLEAEPTSPELVPVNPLAGTFSWAYPGTPVSLQQQWQPGQLNLLTTGAVMQFEMAQGMVADGLASAPVWHALIEAAAKHQMDTSPFDYVIVSESLPETLYVWQDGSFIYNTLVNTGVPGAYTPQGTWPVVYKQNPNLMKGCDIDGSCYSVWVAYASYFLPSVGDAIHAYPRYGYGYPQSNGCVEVDPAAGAVVYGYDPVGTLVTVSSWVGPAQ
jgi:peptidoglycan hydrolase-like protein with peptidoglycan-binding domain